MPHLPRGGGGLVQPMSPWTGCMSGALWGSQTVTTVTMHNNETNGDQDVSFMQRYENGTLVEEF